MLSHHVKTGDWLLFGKDIRLVIYHITEQQVVFKIKTLNQVSRKVAATVNTRVDIGGGISVTLTSIERKTASLEIKAPPSIWLRRSHS